MSGEGTNAQRNRRLLAIIPAWGAALLAIASGDLLLILAALAAAAGLLLLACPGPTRVAGASAQPARHPHGMDGRRAA